MADNEILRAFEPHVVARMLEIAFEGQFSYTEIMERSLEFDIPRYVPPDRVMPKSPPFFHGSGQTTGHGGEEQGHHGYSANAG